MWRFECALGEAPQGDGVRDVRSLSKVAFLAALFAIVSSSSGIAASAGQKANASYASSAASRASEPVPANCVHQEYGKLWCWNTGSSKSSGR